MEQKIETKKEESTVENTTETPVVSAEGVSTDAQTVEVTKGVGASAVGAPRKEHTRNRREQGKRRRAGQREDRRPEFDSKIVSIRRVTRVVAGGRRFSFSVALVAGDHKGKVGVGTGKASDTALAIEKAMRSAKKNMIKVRVTKDMNIAHEVQSKYCASNVLLIPAKGRGIAAGGSVRTVLELAGVKDITGKILSRSKNHLNNARATLKALEDLKV